MPQKYFDADGGEVETLTPDEYKQTQTELETLRKEKEDILAEKNRLEEGGKNKDENFKNIRNLLDEKDKKIEDFSKRLSDREEYEKKSVKDSLIKHYAGDDEESRKKLEAEYGFINLDESTPENIATRMEKAAKVSGLYKEEGRENPVFKGVWGGQAPNLKPTGGDKNDADNVLNTDKGKSALSAMGVPADYGQKKDDKK